MPDDPPTPSSDPHDLDHETQAAEPTLPAQTDGAPSPAPAATQPLPPAFSPATPPDGTSPPDDPGTSGRPGTPALIALGALLLVAVGVGAFFLLRDDDSDANGEQIATDTDGTEDATDGKAAENGEDTTGVEAGEDGPEATESQSTTTPAPTTTSAPTTQSDDQTGAQTSNSPEDPFYTVFRSMADEDCRTMVDQFSHSVQAEEGGQAAMMAECETQVAQATNAGVDFMDIAATLITRVISVDGDRAMVELRFSDGMSPEVSEIEVIVENGAWKVNEPA